MRRISFLVMLAAGVAIAASAFFPFATSSGGNIVLEGGSVPSELGGIDSYVGIGALVAGALVVVAAFMIRAGIRWIGAILSFLGGAAAVAAGAYALYDPEDFYARVGSALVGEGPKAVLEIVDNFELEVTSGTGAWIAAVGGAIALIGTVALLVAGREPRATRLTPPEAVAGHETSPSAHETSAVGQESNGDDAPVWP